MSVHRMSKVKPKRYGDYRNQMKLSRTSEEHRNRRNRQMAEAQRLLDHSCIPDNTINNKRVADQGSGGGKSAQKINNGRNARKKLAFYHDQEDTSYADASFDAPKLIDSSSQIVSQGQRNDEKARSRKPQRNGRVSHPTQDRYNDELIPSPQTGHSTYHSYTDTADEGDGGDLINNTYREIDPSKRSSSIECPKIQQLKQRMFKRRERRRQRHIRMEENSPPPGIRAIRYDRQKTSSNHSVPTNDYSRFDDAEEDFGEIRHFGTGPIYEKSPEVSHQSEDEHHTLYQHTPSRNMGRQSLSDHSRNGKSSQCHSPKVAHPFRSRTPTFRSDERLGVESDTESVVDIELIYCHHCQRSSAPATYKRFCETLDESGIPKCIAMRNKKRKVYNSAKVRITNNTALNAEDQRVVISGRKKVVSELRQKAKGKKKKKPKSKWRQESEEFRKAMETNRLISKAEKEGRPAHYYL